MNHNELGQIAKQWDQMTHTVLNLAKFSWAEMQALLKETYQVLTAFHKDDCVPKEISKILLNMDEFLYFVTLVEEKEVAIDFFHYQAICAAVDALKKGFFHAEYKFPFPKLQIYDGERGAYVFDMECDKLEDLIS